MRPPKLIVPLSRWKTICSWSVLLACFHTLGTARACEKSPNPYTLLSQLDRDYKGHASAADFKRLNKNSLDFKMFDVNKDGKVTVGEIRLYQKEEYRFCRESRKFSDHKR